MKRRFGMLLLPVCAIVLALCTASAASAEAVDSECSCPEPENGRTDGTYTFCLSIDECGECVHREYSSGTLDATYRFSDADWHAVRMTASGADGSASCAEPRWTEPSQDIVLRVCSGISESGGTRQIRNEFLLYSTDGFLLSHSFGTLPALDGGGEVRLCFEVLSPTDLTVRDVGPAQTTGGASEEKTRTWTYLSRDGRPLWRVDLTGVFDRGICIASEGTVTVPDASWECSEQVFWAEADRACVSVTFHRRVLGVRVATQRCTFCVTP